MSAVRHELVNLRMLPPVVEDIVDAELVDVDEDLAVPVRTTRSSTPTRGRVAAPASTSRWAPPTPASRVKRDAATQRAVEAHRRQLWRLAGFTAGGWAAAVVAVVLAWQWYRGWVIGILLVLGVVTALLSSCASSLRRTSKRSGQRGRCVGC